MALGIAAVAFVLAAIPALLFLRNLRVFRPPIKSRDRLPGVSVLIPARNEEKTIGAAIAAALSNDGLPLEVVVLNDQSTDATGLVLHAIAAVDSRVTILHGSAMPQGWCGKQYACAQLAHHARYPLICFIDADVSLRRDALARMAAFLQASGADLASGVPRQETVTFLEKLLIPLIHFMLLAFLPIKRMRKRSHVAYAAGCGQLFIARAEAYRRAGGHAAIRSTLHDGLNLPRAFRRAGLKTDLFDATPIATCRMYRSNREVWQGLRKNAAEGLGSPGLILPATLVLTIGQIAPIALLFLTEDIGRALSMGALILSYVTRVAAQRRFHQSILGALLHPLGVALLLSIQWQAFVGRSFGGSVEWKGRAYSSAGSQPR